MPGYVITEDSTVACTHQGQATPTAGLARVKVDGGVAIAQVTPYQVSGCALPAPPAANGPCVTGLWQSGTVRVTSLGLPLAIQETPGLCAPSGTPMNATATQLRVVAT